MSRTPDHRRSLLVAALGFMRLEWPHGVPAPVAALRAFMDSWRGLGAVAAGMQAHGFRLHLTNVDDDVWRAVQRAAWIALFGLRAAP